LAPTLDAEGSRRYGGPVAPALSLVGPFLIEPGELRDLLDGLATRFEEATQAVDQFPDGRGWGQFLDAPKQHRQVGPYGTSAGIVVLALAGRGQTPLIRQASALLQHWWTLRDTDDYARQRFVQTTRLAFLHLALRLSGLPEIQAFCGDVRQTLLDRLLPSRMWGAYWITAEFHDHTPRIFPTAVALLSFTLLHDASNAPDETLLGIAATLAEKLTLERTLPPHEVAVASAAVLATQGPSVTPTLVRRLSRMLLSRPLDVSERSAYFFDYEYPADPSPQPRFGRDYFIIPVDVLFATAAFQPGVSSLLRLRAQAVLRQLASNLRSNDRAYRPADGERLSTIDQAWCALLLNLSSGESRQSGLTATVAYALLRHRRDNWFTTSALPMLSLIVVTVLSTLASNAGPATRVFAAFATLVVGGLYAPKVFRRLVWRQ
jgi:hypothetical protein